MPLIKTGKWVGEILKELNMGINELSESSGVSVSAIEKIIEGDYFGQAETWERIFLVLNKHAMIMKDSFSCESTIEYLNEDIEHLGPMQECSVFYEEKNGSIILIEYVLPEDMKNDEYPKDDLIKLNTITMTLMEAHDLFSYQNEIL